MKSFTIERLKVKVYKDRAELGRAAAEDVGAAMREIQAGGRRVRAAFAAAPSQDDFLEALSRAPGVDWSRVEAFQLDEYVGLPASSPRSHQAYLARKLFSVVRPGEVRILDGTAPPRAECARYGELIRRAPLDIVCLGIGNNGHLALNEPHAADFNDPETVKIVELDRISLRQQVQTGIFARLEEVPRFALTLTLPVLRSAARAFCIVPGFSKREAVRQALQGPITTACPASLLREHPDATLYLELDSHGR